MNIVDKIIAWESGELSDPETVALFQELIDSGHVWSLQGCYGRQAKALIDAGYCHAAREAKVNCPYCGREYLRDDYPSLCLCREEV